MVITRRSSTTIYPFDLFYLPERYLKKAEDELNETSQNKQEAVQKLRQLILAEKDVTCRTSDEFLMQFLRARKYNVPKAFALIKKFHNFRKKNLSIFTGAQLDILQKFNESRTMGFLPNRCPDGCAVLVVHLNNWSPSEMPIDELSRAIVLFLYHSINDPMTQVNGYKCIFDVKSHPLKHIRFITPYNIYRLYSGTQECFPGRFKAFHVINMSLTFKAAWALVQPFLSDKLKKRFVFHSDKESLFQYFPESMIPISFGGQLKDFDNTSFLKHATQIENLERIAN